MTGPRVSVVVTLLAALVLAVLPSRALADDRVTTEPSVQPLLSYRERGCTEIAYERGGLASVVRPLVPDRFALQDFPGVPAGGPPRVYLTLNEVTCERGRFPGRGDQRGPYTFLIVSAYVSASEGRQREGAYVLFYATENRTQLKALRRLGWPVRALNRRTTTQITRDTSGGVLGASLHVVGRDWNHDLSFIATAPPTPVEPRTSEYYRDTVAGHLTLCYANQVSVGSALYSGDLRGTAFATVAYIPPLFTGFPGDLVVGGWDATVTTGDCPTSTTPARPPLAHS